MTSNFQWFNLFKPADKPSTLLSHQHKAAYFEFCLQMSFRHWAGQSGHTIMTSAVWLINRIMPKYFLEILPKIQWCVAGFETKLKTGINQFFTFLTRTASKIKIYHLCS